MPNRCSLAAFTLLLASSAVSQAQELNTISHRVLEGDTLDLLAAEFYGNRDHAIFIMKVNGITHKRPLKKGERLRIPVPITVTSQEGDSWDGLAEKHLGDARRGAYLASFNKQDARDSLAAGQRLRVPFHVRHRAERRVSLREIAAAYLRDPGQARFLRDYNFLDRGSLDKGDSIVIPLEQVELHASKQPKLDKASADLIEKRSRWQREARKLLPELQAAWQNGQYKRVKVALSPLNANIAFLDASQAVEVGVLYGRALVAFDEDALALAAFTKVLERKPNHTLSDYTYSPKVRAVWKAAKDALQKR